MTQYFFLCPLLILPRVTAQSSHFGRNRVIYQLSIWSSWHIQFDGLFLTQFRDTRNRRGPGIPPALKGGALGLPQRLPAWCFRKTDPRAKARGFLLTTDSREGEDFSHFSRIFRRFFAAGGYYINPVALLKSA
jgi:hypothetical protein